MIRIQLLLIILTLSLFAACKKDDVKETLPVGSVSLEGVPLKDTIIREMHAGFDSAVAIGIKAVLNTGVSKADHYVTIRQDTSRMREYRAKYGNARVLPSGNFFFYSTQVRIPAGKSISDSILLNITRQSSLRQLTEYVLPIVINQVDGRTESVNEEEVLFLVVKTGKGTSISKLDWTIADFSGSASINTNLPVNLLDVSTGTSWATAIGMPQYVVIDFGDAILFSGVSYAADPVIAKDQGYPTQVKFELSMDGTTWEDKGTFEGVRPPAAFSHSFGLTTARYMRFSVLAVVPIFGFAHFAYIGDLSLIP